jgi:hypothetical protein
MGFPEGVRGAPKGNHVGVTDPVGKEAAMKIVGLSLSQFMRVETVNMSFSPSGVITIAGENGSGKTSVETFIELCFGGKDRCPPLPVRIGEKKAIGKLTLDNEGHCVTIEVEVGTDRSVKAVVRQDGGKPFDGPVTMLKAMVSRFTFNPFALMRLTGQEQRRVMLDCLGVSFDDLEVQAEKVKEERKIVGRDRNGRERQIAMMPEHAGVPAKEISVAALSKSYEAASAAIRANDARRQVATVAAADAERAKSAMEIAQEAVSTAVAHGRELVDEARRALDAAETRVKGMEADAIAKAEAARQASVQATSAAAEACESTAKLKDPDTAAIKAKLDSADATNAKVRANAARSALVAQFQQDHDRYKELGEQLEGIEKAKQDRLNAAKCPVKGLEFRDDGVWYQGLPLSQDMESDQMIRSVQLAAALNPKLRTILIDNGERMLPAKLKELNDWAEANDYQVIMFRASSTAEGCAFFLESGRLRDEDEAPPPEGSVQ